MKYAKWSVYFPNGSQEGTTPDVILRERGYDASGLFFDSDFVIVGNFSDNADLSGLENYNIEEITQEEMLNLAKSKNPDVILLENGSLYIPVEKE